MPRQIFYRDGSEKPVFVQSVADISRALQMAEWSRDDTYVAAAEKAAQALEGHCSPKAAFAAFVALAQKQGRYVPPASGEDISIIDGLIREWGR